MSMGMDERFASYRYRMAIPGAGLKKMGHKVRYVESFEPVMADVAIFMKHGIASESCQAMEMKKLGVRVVFDICDNHFNNPNLAPHYRAMVGLADCVTVPTEAMAETVRDETSTTADVVVIPDPYEHEELEPHAVGERLTWFGHNLNVREIVPYLSKLVDWKVSIVTGPNDVVPAIPWSMENIRKLLSETNVVFIPSKKKGASANRMVEAIRSGCFVVASDVPQSYLPFAKWMYVGNVETGLSWVKDHQDELNERVKEAQGYVREQFDPDLISGKWEAVL